MKTKILFLMFVLILTLFCGCSNSALVFELSSDIEIVCAEEESTYVQNISADLNDFVSSIKDESGTVKELILGDSGREESVALKETFTDDTNYKISYDGDKVVIVAKSDLQLEYAVRRFLNLVNRNGEIVMNTPEIESTISESEGLANFFDDNYVQFSWEDADASLICAGCTSPRVHMLDDGVLVAGFESPLGIQTARSYDNGKTWQENTIASFYPDIQCANVNFFQDGESLYISYRAVDNVNRENGFYTSLRVSVSTDGGKTWSEHSTIVESNDISSNAHGYWEPFLGILNGKLVAFYANDSRRDTNYQFIEYRTWNGETWENPVIVSNGDDHSSRDGMPAWTQLRDGTYVLMIESTIYSDEDHPFILQMLYSKDGINWSEPKDIYYPTTKGSKAAGPGIVELPNGQLVISFQTDEDATVKGDSTSVMKTIISDGTSVYDLTHENFSESKNIFGTPDGESSLWTGIYYHDGYLYATAGTWSGAELKVINIG